MTGVIGGGLLTAGTVAGLVLADTPLTAVAALAVALLSLLGVWGRLRLRWQSRKGRAVPPSVHGPRVLARPEWTQEDRRWLESTGAVLPEGRQR